MKKIIFTIPALTLIFAIGCTKDTTTTSDCSTVSAKYAANVKPILTSKCGGSSCHPSNEAMFEYADVKSHVDAGHFKTKVIDQKSMPPAGSTQLTTSELNIISCWLSNGAKND